MEFLNIMSGEIIVALMDMQTCQGNYNMKAGWIDLVTAKGTASCQGEDTWVLRTKNCSDDYYPQYSKKKKIEYFRLATERERKEYHMHGYHELQLLSFNEGDYVTCESAVSTTDGHSHNVPAGYVGKVDNIIKKEVLEDSVFWFDTGHKGWFSVNHFRLATAQEVKTKLQSNELLGGLVESLKQRAEEVAL